MHEASAGPDAGKVHQLLNIALACAEVFCVDCLAGRINLIPGLLFAGERVAPDVDRENILFRIGNGDLDRARYDAIALIFGLGGVGENLPIRCACW